MTVPSRPLPPVLPEFTPFWNGLREGRLMLPVCEECGPFFYPRIVCPTCHRRVTGWVECSGRGTLYSFAIAHAPLHPGWKGPVPYVLAMVELDEGPRLSTNLVGVEPDPAAIRIGMPVELVCEKLTDEVTVALFRPAGAGAAA